MAGFENAEVRKATNIDAKAGANALMNDRSRSGSGHSNTLAMDIVGMNVHNIGDVIQAINTYVNDIETYVKGIEAAPEAADKYFRSSQIRPAMEKYIKTVAEYCANLCSQLRAFADKLQDARNAWIFGAGNISSSISGAAGDINTGSSYTSQF